MNSGQQLSRILFLPDKLKIITFWLSQYVTLLLCHMALDAETQHQVTPKLEGWNTGESRVSIWKDLNKPEKQPSQNLMRFNKAKWSCALGSEVPHVPGQPEQTAPQLQFGAHTTTAAHSPERPQGRAAEAIREPQHLRYKERQRPLPCLGWRQEAQDRI